MILEGRFAVAAPRERVWEAIWDVPTLAGWVPGCASAEEVGPGAYRVRLEQQVGFLRASFDLRLEVAEAHRPERIRLRGAGEDRRLRSSVQIETEVHLEPAGDGTVIRYRHDLSVFGRLAALGFPLVQRKAREIEDEFARRASAALAAR